MVNIDGLPEGDRLILKVKAITVNSGRTAFNLKLEFNTTDYQLFSRYRKLGFHVIFIGTKFNTNAPKWSGSTDPLAGGFARNSDLVAVTTANGGADITRFSFAGVDG